MASVREDGWCYLLPAGYEGCVLDLECGCEAEPSVGDGREQLYVVIRCELRVQPFFVQDHSDGVEVVGRGFVEPDGAGGERGVACCGGAPEGLGNVCVEPLCL